MSPYIIIFTIAIYLCFLFSISYLSGRKADNNSFFVGNHQSSWYIVAIAMIGSSISGVTYVSVPGMVDKSCFGYLQMVLGFIVGQIVIAFVLVPLFYRLKLISIYEYLESRFGKHSYRTGAWFFFISKMLGASVRLFLVCLALQILVFEPLHLPFLLNVLLTMFIIWLYTVRGGVKSLIWTDLLKTFCLCFSVILCIYFIVKDLGMSLPELSNTIYHNHLSKIFFFEDVNNKQYFFKQFFAGVFLVIATTGLDQDMMQRNLSCKNSKDSQKNMIVSSMAQFVIILLFLILGLLLYMFAAEYQITVAASDELFPRIATSNYFPVFVGILFIIGLVSSAYSAAGSAMTALTTSFTVDIIGIKNKTDEQIGILRKRIHVCMAIVMGITIVLFNILNSTSVIDAVYILASYTYGPILGMFIFGLLMKNRVRDKYIPIVALVSPLLCFILQRNSEKWFAGYQFSYELLLFNAFFTFIGLCLLIIPQSNKLAPTTPDK